MSKFITFRVFIALLAAFGGFFAYFCRLNLSLVIHEMSANEALVSPAATDDTQTVPAGQAGRARGRSMSLSTLRLEEQTLAALSAAGPKWVWEETSFGKPALPLARSKRANDEDDDETAAEAAARRQAAKRLRTASLPQVLSIDFDATPTRVENQSDSASAEAARERPHYLLDPLPKLNWSKEARNDLLGAFFLGYVIFQIPLARAAEIVGAKTLILVGGFGTGLTSILFVLSARLLGDAIWCAYLTRFLMGVSQAGLYPAFFVFYCQWLPKSERSYWLPAPSAMSRVGTIAMNFIAPLIVRHYGWPMVFIFSGSVTIAWALLFLIFASSAPATSRWLSSTELLHIQSRLEPRGTPGADTKLAAQIATCSINDVDEPPPPCADGPAKPGNSVDWLKITTNRPIAILALVMFSSDWSNNLLLVLLPGFLGPALGMELEEIGTWTILLVTVYCFGYPLSGALASRLDRADWVRLSSLNIRKLFEATAHLLQASGCLLIGFYGNKTIILTALFIIMLGRSTVGGGQCLMPPELSREYPGTVMAYANAISNLAGYFGPMIVNWLVRQPNSYEDWRVLWLTSAAIFIFCGLMFVLFASNAPQDLTRQQKPAKSISQIQLTLPPYLPPPYDPSAGAGQNSTSANGGQAATAAAGDDGTDEDVRAPKKRVVNRDIEARMSAFAGAPGESPSSSQTRAAPKPNRRI